MAEGVREGRIPRLVQQISQNPLLLAGTAIAGVLVVAVVIGVTQAVRDELGGACSETETIARMNELNALVLDRINVPFTMHTVAEDQLVLGAGASRVMAALARNDPMTACRIVGELEQRLRR